MVTMEVNGLVPGKVYGVNTESTAEKQAKAEETVVETKTKKQLRTEARQAKRDEKDYAKIRAKLIEKVFEMSGSDIKLFNSKIEEYKKKTENMTEAERIRHLLEIADGANADTRASIITLGSGLFTTGLGAVVSGLEGESLALVPLFGGLVSLNVTIPFIAGAVLAAAGIGLAAWTVIRTIRGKKSDTLIKQLGGMEEAQAFIDKIEKFAKEIENDKDMLLEKQRSMNKKDFDKYLNEYIKGKSEFLKKLGVQKFVNAMRNAEVAEAKENQRATQTPAMAGAMV